MFDKCYTVVRGNMPGKRIAILRIGDIGYFPTDIDRADYTEAQAKALVAELNRDLGVDLEVQLSMELGSMFGWDVPGAKKALDFAGVSV
jgi:hypothetical protein